MDWRPWMAVALALSPRQASRDLLDQLASVVSAVPGITEAGLRRRTGLPRSSVRHHLRSLEESGVLKSKAVRKERHYFAAGMVEGTLDRESAVAHGRAHAVLREILLDPGLAQQDLCERVGMTRKILGGYLDVLADNGLIVATRDGRFQRYFAGPGIEADFSARLLETAPGLSDPTMPRLDGRSDLLGDPPNRLR